MSCIEQNIAKIKNDIQEAANKAGRAANEIKLMGVSKFHPFEAMAEAANFVDFLGENRVQEAAEKRILWNNNPKSTPWHLIGHLQKNKARKALEIFDVIESVDSLELAQTLNRILEETNRSNFPIYLEVNMSLEASKTGMPLEQVRFVTQQIQATCPCLKIDGLMTMAPISDSESKIRSAFSALRELRDKLETEFNLTLPELSMGMSGDFKYAIAEGSTIVRVGTAIFGSR